MADQRDLAKRIGLTPGKTAIVGGLAVTLVVVLYVQYGPSGGAGDAVAAEEVAVKPPSPAHSAQPAGTIEAPAVPVATTPSADVNEAIRFPYSERIERVAWKAPDLSTIVAYDPFALPPTFPRPTMAADVLAAEEAVDEETRASQLADTVAKLRTELEALRQRGVRVIVKERDKYVAMIGDRTVHVGDEINGFTVTAIEPDGVRVERKVQE